MLQFRAALSGGGTMMSVADSVCSRLCCSREQVIACASATIRCDRRFLRRSTTRGGASSRRSSKSPPGLRINSPSDDPVAAARVAHLDASLARLDQYQANAIFARNQLGLEEEALSEAIGNLQRIRELTLQANNASASSGDRQIIASEIRAASRRVAGAREYDRRRRPPSVRRLPRDRATPFTVGCGRQRRLQRRPRAAHAADQRQPLRRDQRLRRRGFPAHSRRQRHVRRWRRRREHGHRHARRRAAVVNPASWVADTYTITFPDADELRGARQRQRARRRRVRSRRRNLLTFAGIELRIDGAPAAGDTFTVAPSAQRDVFATLDRADRGYRDAAGTPAQRSADAQQHRPAPGRPRQRARVT